MKIKSLLIAALIVVFGQVVWAQPQTLPFTQDFENGLGQWTIVNGYDSGGKVKTGVTDRCETHDGDYCFRFYTGIVTSSQYLISPELDGNAAVSVTFWHMNQDEEEEQMESFQVGYSMTTADVSAFVWGEETNSDFLEWTQYEEVFPSGTKYIAVKCTSFNTLGLLLDDFEFEAIAQACPNPTIPVASEITNNSVTLNWTGNSDSYNLKYGQMFSFTFEDEEEFDEWTTIDDDEDGYDWMWSDDEDYPGHASEHMVYSQSYDGGALYPDNYLISPEVPLGGSISFYARGNSWEGYYEEYFGVAVSTSGNTDVEDFETIKEWTATNGWLKYTVDLSDYAGQTGYVAIRHFDCSEQDHLEVDDITIMGPITTVNGVATTRCELQNLEEGSNYFVQVQGVCDGTPTDWSSMCSFDTRNSFSIEIEGYGNSAGGYHLIASPVTVDPEDVPGMTEGSFDLYWFDQSEELEWRNYEAGHFYLTPGMGYLYAKSEDVTLAFNGMPYDGDGIINLACSEDNSDENMRGWNLIGNPYATEAVIGDEYYTLNDEGLELVAGEEYTIAAMQGIFVYAEEEGKTVTFARESKGMKNDVKLNSRMVLNLNGNNGVIDRTIVRFGEGRQLPKFQLNTESTKLYIPQGNNDYAVVRSADEGEIPVSFKAEQNGSYTLCVSIEGTDMGYLHLIDNMTGADIDLLQTPNYTFEATTTDYVSRFRIVFSVNGLGENTDEAFVYNNGSEWMVSNMGESTLQMIDMLGRVVSSESINGNATINTNGLSTGVYVVRLVTSNKVMTQKIVVE